MTLWRRGRQYWMDATINGERHREALGTTDWPEAKRLEKERVVSLLNRPPDPVGEVAKMRDGHPRRSTVNYPF
jgi:hypothetical protein